MNMHENIRADLQAIIDKQGLLEIVSPTSLAIALQNSYVAGDLEPRIRYASLEGLKQIARAVLRSRYDTESEESEAAQGELFSGRLQARYPIPHKRGDEPQYKLRSALTREERLWNVRKLRVTGTAHLLHADALEAEGEAQMAA